MDTKLNGGNRGENVTIYTHKNVGPGDKMTIQTPAGQKVVVVVADVTPKWVKDGKYVEVKK